MQQVNLDDDQINETVQYYRHTSSVLTASANELARGDFGGWGGGAYRQVATAYSERVAAFGEELQRGALAAAAVADALARGAAALHDGDADARRDVTTSAAPVAPRS